MKNSEAILVTPKQFEIQECPVPEPKEHEILMKVEYVGMCGSDIHGFEFGPFIPPKDPNQKIGLGHEVAGEVVGIGSKVTKFKVGDKVLIEPGVPDDTCEYCRTGRYNICPGVDFMATTNLNVRVDENLKKTADTLLNELGLNMSTAINIYLKQIVRENGIPFEIKLDKPNAETLQAMQDVREGKNLHGPFNSLSELMEDLNADD